MVSFGKKKGKVFVGLSGGVDSSVSAALLQKNGYDVVGVFIKVWQPDFLPCTWRDDRRDAMKVAAKLGIPYHTFDFEEAYKRNVIDSMLADYRAGKTPNPDVLCNRSIKFGAFLKAALAEGADFIATGHYAQIKSVADKKALLAGADPEKDQSYFLWTLTQEDLKRVIFPVGGFHKPQVRERAAKFGLPTAAKKESQGLCFMGELDMRQFLKRFIPSREGAVLSVSGKTIGTHGGAAYYTIGSRHGFRITTRTAHETPQYIIEKDIQKNTLTVSENPLRDGGIQAVELESVNWIREAPDTGRVYGSRIRYRQPLQVCRVEKNSTVWRVRFESPQTGVALGQSVVLHDGNECLGGGIIKSSQ